MHTRVLHVRAQQADLLRRVDAGAPVQQEPRHLLVPFLRRHDEARRAVLRRAGGVRGQAGQGRDSPRERVPERAVGV